MPSTVRRLIRPTFGVLAYATLTLALASCVTGPRPTLGPSTTLAAVTDEAILDVIDVLSIAPSTPFTVVYDITMKYGSITATAEYSFDPNLGTAILIDGVLYVFPIAGSAVTCTWFEESLSAQECASGTDETRVSHLQVNSRVFKDAAIDRLARDAQVAAREAESRETSVADRNVQCADVPVIDGSGAERTKSYCAFADLGVLAVLETGDLAVAAVFVDDVATESLFEVSGADA